MATMGRNQAQQLHSNMQATNANDQSIMMINSTPSPMVGTEMNKEAGTLDRDGWETGEAGLHLE